MRVKPCRSPLQKITFGPPYQADLVNAAKAINGA
jgi:hypothetical protein